MGDNSLSRNGFSLLEFLVATGLGVLVLAAILKVYLVCKNIYSAQKNLLVMSENIQFADWVLWKEIVQAGYTGDWCVSNLDFYNPDFKYFGVRAYSKKKLPSYLTHKKGLSSDVLVISRVTKEVFNLQTDLNKGCKEVELIDGSSFKKNDFLFFSDDENADLIQIEEIKADRVYLKNNLHHSYCKQHAKIRGVIETTLFISSTSRVDAYGNVIRSLYIVNNRGNKRELIIGVEAMELLFGVSNLGVSNIDQYLVLDDVDQKRLWDRVLVVVIKLKFNDKGVFRWKKLCVRLRQLR